MYKTRNTGTGNKMRGTRGMGGMSPNIPGNVAKHSGECPQTFVAKDSGECHKTFWGMSPNIPGNVVKHSR